MDSGEILMTKRKILVIEGNDKMRSLICLHLSINFDVMGASHGVEAAGLMRKYLPDLILIDQDVSLGGIRTARILRLHPQFQQIPILMALRPEKDNVLKLVEEGRKINLKAYIGKPYTLPTLEKKIEENIKIKLGPLALPDIREELANLTDLPVLSPVHQKMLQLLGQEDEDVNIRELVRTIETDQGLLASMMRTCRTAHFGFRGNTISTAVTFMGINEIRKIVQAAIIFNIFAEDHQGQTDVDFSLIELWKHSVACGVIMEMGYRHVKGRDHFIGGIMHDVGKILLFLRFPDHFREVVRIAKAEQKSMYQAERELLGLTHEMVGSELALKWDLPSTISMCIAFHHHPSIATMHKRFIALAHVSDILARSMHIGYGGDDQPIEMDDYAKRIAKSMLTVPDKRDEIVAQVESIVPDNDSAPKEEEVRHVGS